MHRTQGLSLFARRIPVLRVNNGVNETLGITTQLKIASEVTNFIIEILALLAYGSSSFVKIN
jgi:hypothetical protein